MPKIRPFTGIRFDLSRGGRLEDVVAPPYDVISPEQEERLRSRSAHNIVRLDLPRDEDGKDRYQVSGELFKQWLSSGALVRDPEPRIYVSRKRFQLEGREHTLTGIMAAVGLEPLGASILPHEETLVGPREDRLSLMRTTEANLSPIYGIYSDPARDQAMDVRAVASGLPLLDVTDENGVRHTMWSTSDERVIRGITEAISPHPIFIADGHHRYKTALTYQEERRRADASPPDQRGDHPYDYTLMLLVNVDDGDLVTLPVHRLVRNLGELDLDDIVQKLSGRFSVQKSDTHSATDLLSRVQADEGDQMTFGLYAGPNEPTYMMRMRPSADPDELIRDQHSPEWKRLDVTLLHRLVIEGTLGVDRKNVENQRDVAFVKSLDEAVRRVDSGEYQLALLVNATPVDAVQTIARLGETMPQKSTYFYPKPLTGLVLNPLY